MFRTELWFFFYFLLLSHWYQTTFSDIGVRERERAIKRRLNACKQFFPPSKAKYHVAERESVWTVDRTPCCHSISMLRNFFFLSVSFSRLLLRRGLYYLLVANVFFFFLSFHKMSLSVVMAAALLFNFVCSHTHTHSTSNRKCSWLTSYVDTISFESHWHKYKTTELISRILTQSTNVNTFTRARALTHIPTNTDANRAYTHRKID